MRSEVFLLRQNIYRFLHEQVFPAAIEGTVVEIGPMQKQWTPIQEFYVDTRAHFAASGQPYLACDKDAGSGAELICDVLNLGGHLQPASAGAIIAAEVLEHVSRVWEVPKIFARILKPNGLLFITVPYYFYRHAPFPDYWRISEDGLRLLFSDDFEMEIEPLASDDDRKPIGYTVVARKKQIATPPEAFA